MEFMSGKKSSGESATMGPSVSKRKATSDADENRSPLKSCPGTKTGHGSCPDKMACEEVTDMKRLKLASPPSGASSKTPPGTLHSCSLNTLGTTIKGIYVEKQHRHVIEQKISKVVTKGVATVTYKVKSETTGEFKMLHLKGMWAELDYLTPGTLVNIVQVDENSKVFVVDRCEGYLIVNPDRLVSVTSVIGQLYCERKAALSRFYMGGDNAVTFRGVVAHELICMAMVDHLTNMADLRKALRRICQRPGMLERAYGIALSDLDLAKIQAEVSDWVLRFMKKRFLSSSTPRDPKYQNFEFSHVLGVEDNIWNPTFGLKGKIDATVQIGKDNQFTTVPLEFKTGSTKSQKRQAIKADHVAQVSLYTLMMTIKFGTVEEALLYYISDDSLSTHRPRVLELQQLIMKRNQYIRNSTLVDGEFPYLPKPVGIDFDFKCKTCDARNICTLDIVKRNEPVEALTSTEQKLKEQCELSEKELKFFSEWLLVINSETEEIEKKFNDKDIWTKTPEQREANGTCVSGLKLIGKECTPWKDSSLRNGFLATFKQWGNDDKDHGFHVDDFVALSSNVEICISYGIVVMIRGNEITLSLEQPLHPGYFVGNFSYTVDKINTSSPIASQYGYLASLMNATPEAVRLREQIILKKQPTFDKLLLPSKKVQEIIQDLNGEQKRVVTKSLATDSYLFVKGTPGSGKTKTIVALLRALVSERKSVLVVSYTGTALENILVRFKNHFTNFVKISTSGRTDAKLAEFTTKEISKSVKTLADLEKAYNKQVIATTLLSLKHPIFQRRRFDYCIVDEASQALPTAVFGALCLSDKYIVFGDPHQLPPVMTSNVLRTRNMSDNFFTLMATPVSTIKMNTQYRMNRGITNVANALIYDNQMSCANGDLERAYINLPENRLRDFLKTQVKSSDARRMFCQVVSKKREKAVVFLDTSDVPAFENRMEESLSNEAEKNLAIGCCRILIESGLQPDAVGIIAPYRGQVRLLRSALQSMPDTRYREIEVNTVDQYQGREMQVIICTFTKSASTEPNFCRPNKDNMDTNRQPDRESILEDIRRLNVAITRARVKLVMIGNGRTLSNFSPFRKLFEILTDEQRHKLTSAELEGMCFPALAHLREKNENVLKQAPKLQ